MDIDQVPHGISQIDLAWMREQARDDSSPSDDDLQDVSDAEVMFDTITASFEKSSMCPRINSHESVSLVFEGKIMGRGERVTIFNGSSAQLGTLSQPYDIPMVSIMADGVARVDAVTLDLNENSKTVPIQLTLYGAIDNRDRCKTILKAAEAAFRTVTKDNAGNSVAQEQHVPTGVTTQVPSNVGTGNAIPHPAAGHAASPLASLHYDPYIQVDSHRQKLTQDEIISAIDQLFETLNEGDKTTEREPVEAVRTPLYPHQKQALHWMMTRENEENLPPFWEETPSGHYSNILLNHTTYERPPSIRGGILADDMGLGKTLEIISLILTNFVDNRPLALPVPGVPRVRREKAVSESYSRMEPSESRSKSETRVAVANNNDDMFQRLQSYHEFIDQMDEEQPTKKTACPTKLRFGKPDSSNIETTGTVTTRLDDMSDVGSTPANRTINSTMQRKATITELVEPTNGKRKCLVTETDLVNEKELSKQRKLQLDSLHSESGFSAVCNAQSSIHTDVINVGVSSDVDKQSRFSGNVGRMEDEGVDASRKIQSDMCGEKYHFYDELPDLEDEELCDEGSGADFMTANHCDEKGRTLCEKGDPRGTLIICPLCVLRTWQDQFEEHVHPNIHIDVHVYHGSKRCKDSSFIKCKDVVITTYGIVRSEFKKYVKGEEAPVFTLNWLRIVLDEGHIIRNPRALQTKAVLALKAQRKWVLSGTPIQNRMLDLYPLVSFLNVTPLKQRHWWDSLLEKPLQRGIEIIFKRVQHLMENIAMRRTKNTLVNGEPLVKLPKREVYMERIKMSDEESRRYKFLEERGKIVIKQLVRHNEMGRKNYLVLEIILRLRQMSCHTYLVPQSWLPHDGTDAKNRGTLVDRLQVISESDEDCSVCVEVLKNPVILPCTHCFCRLCILYTIKYMEQTNKTNATCPMCRAPISQDQIIELPAQPEPHTYGDWKSSTKVDALMRALVNLRSEDPSVKSLVASQFTSFLTLIETPLRELKFRFVRLDGTMSVPQRMEAVKKFFDPEPGSPTIFLISICAGGLGLNLTAASRVFLMEPQWNPAVEEQCFDRCHRLGQTKDVIITKFISEDTIEERMLDLQEKKRRMMQQAFKKQQTATERKKQRIRDLKAVMNIV
ncbi:helicase-like transcription factor isoform X3 [Haliotis rufescens]|uniref:helicase-like transcription factor isoform X3 n=1 Tax=Haliotis rufescens TaxID=6454 RepID=UPI00201F0DD8|nr:helicase-like transcription factor isoform X3 [Haliotis rufescens]XP_048240658.1 helicase-like transcription factor isoform X3 [Haliotis rufescens]XP_048240659.1 helicase-like transcription factor isoform X3 [Haliotis rufescens]